MDKFRVYACVLMRDAKLRKQRIPCTYASKFLERFSVEKSAHYMWVNTGNNYYLLFSLPLSLILR